MLVKGLKCDMSDEEV